MAAIAACAVLTAALSPPTARLACQQRARPVQLCDDSYESYEATPSPVKKLVSGLTAIVNSFGSAGAAEAARAERTAYASAVSPSELLEGVRADYEERMYLWTGDIDPNIYDADCTFTDPTLSFSGLDQFQRNIENLQPILQRLVKDPVVELYTCDLDESERVVSATWRMKGDIALPWRPRIDLNGRTRFVYEPDAPAMGRITEYIETWEIEAGDALMQLLRPFAY